MQASSTAARDDAGEPWIDTHAHFWRGDLVSISGTLPPELNRTYHPDQWLQDFRPFGVASCVFVETGESDAELELLTRWSTDSPSVVGFIAPIAPDGSDVAAALARWHDNPMFRGVRAHFQDGHGDSLSSMRLRSRLALLEEAGSLFEFLVKAEQLPDVYQLCRSLPDLDTVIEHMGKPILQDDVDPAWYSAMEALASDTTAVVKLSLSPRPDEFSAWVRDGPTGFPLDRVARLVDALLDLFGPDRLVWGSDWPLALHTSSPAQLISGWQKILVGVSHQLTATARRVYRIDT